MSTSTTSRKCSGPIKIIGKRQGEEPLTKNNHLEKWFLGNQKQMVVYLHDVINGPKFLKIYVAKGTKT